MEQQHRGERNVISVLLDGDSEAQGVEHVIRTDAALEHAPDGVGAKQYL